MESSTEQLILQEIREIKKDVKGLKETVQGHDKRFDELTAIVKGHDKKIDELTKNVTRHTEEIKVLQRSTLLMETELTKKVDLTLELLTSYMPKTAKNEEKIQEHDFRIDVLESVVKDRIYKIK